MAIQKVGVVGCGLMGSGIAQVTASAGFQTVVREVNGEIVEKGLKNIDKNLARLIGPRSPLCVTADVTRW